MLLDAKVTKQQIRLVSIPDNVVPIIFVEIQTSVQFFLLSDPQADFEATEMLVGCAENLMGSARSVVKDCEAASIKIRTGAGKVQRWKRDNSALYSYQLDKRY